jgi:phenylalanyl-tRNA synthetase beta chain
LNEALSLRFVSRANLDRLFSEKDPRRDAVRILNPLSEEWALLPTSPIPHLLQTVSTNARNREEAVRYFEVAHLFAPAPEKATDKDPGVVESDRLAMVIAGKWPEGRGDRNVDFFDLKGILEALLRELGVPAEFRRATKQERYAHPYRHAEILINGVVAGEICEVHPLMREQFEFDAMPAVICDLDYSKIVELALPQEQFTPFSRFGAVTRDLSLIVDHRIDQEEIYQKLLQIPAKNRVALHFVESYCGQGVPEGKRNLLYQSVYQLSDGSLTDDEVNQAQERFVAQVSALPGVEVR